MARVSKTMLLEAISHLEYSAKEFKQSPSIRKRNKARLMCNLVSRLQAAVQASMQS